MRWIAGLALAAIVSPAAAEQPLPKTPDEWRALASRDLDAMREALRENSPIFVVERDSAPMRAWADEGYAEAKAKLPEVKDAASAKAVLYFYAGGFRDAHIRVGDNSSLPEPNDRWPGLLMRWNGSAYVVGTSEPASGEVSPPKGAILRSCDGQSAESVARHRLDKVYANLDLDNRDLTAPLLLWDLGNPFAGPVPRRCTFTTGGKSRSYALHYRPFSWSQASKLFAGLAHPRPALGIAPWGKGRWWLTIPSFGDADWKGFFGKVRNDLPQLRSADAVVIDLRGNGGGNSAYAEQLAKLLYGEQFVAAHAPDLGPIVYRVSKANRRTYANYLDKVRSRGGDAETIASLQKIVDDFDAALAKGAATFETADDMPVRPASAPANPVKGRVILLTDGACTSACLDAMDLFLAMPGTVQAGTKTSADTIFMDISHVDLPSGIFTILYGHKAWVKRPRGSNVPYVPAPRWTYRGDLQDDAGWKSWLHARLGG